GRIDEHGNASGLWNQLMQEPQPLGCHLFGEKINASRVASRTRETIDKTELDGISCDTEHDRDGRGCGFSRARRRPAARYSNHGHRPANEIAHDRRQTIVLALQPLVLNSDILPFD